MRKKEKNKRPNSPISGSSSEEWERVSEVLSLRGVSYLGMGTEEGREI
jgi:hypothetical protein